MVGSTAAASLLARGDENPLYNIMRQDLMKSSSSSSTGSGNVAKSCYGDCESDEDCCFAETRCLTYKYRPHCVWCPSKESHSCGAFDKCCPGFQCIIYSGFTGTCKPNSWCAKQGEQCNGGIPCCSGLSCNGFFSYSCEKE
ncbi:unnamed protein product [Amaranthus hypochondriacus]